MPFRKKTKLYACFSLFAVCIVLIFALPEEDQIAQLALLFTPEPEEVQPQSTILSVDESAERAGTPEEIEPVEEETAPARDDFGFELGKFQVSDHRLKRHQTFSEILRPYNVSPQTIIDLAEKAEPTFDVRHFRAGQNYRIYEADSSAQLLVYQQDPIRYVVFDLRDSMRVYEGERTVTFREREASGVIQGSLYQTLVENDADPELAFRMADVFAWQIDFYRIQPGDHYKVIYQERLVGGEPIGVGDIIAARFNHFDNDFYAFYFEQDDFGGYYDENGHSLRKALLKSPLKYSVMTSAYTQRRYHPVLKRYKAHLGTDYAAPKGTPIMSTGDGIVIEAGRKRGNGIYVKIRHNNTYTTGYLHMSKLAEGITRGAKVQQGQVIGYVGSTGLATGPHVCYRFWKKGVQVDSRKEELPPSEPVEETYREAFETTKRQLIPKLRSTAASHLVAADEEEAVAL